MDEDEKRELAKLLIPHLAWDLSRSDIFNYVPDNLLGTGAAVWLDQLIQHIRRKMHDGETFAVALIPVGKKRLGE